MKNTIKLLGIIALVAVIGFSFASCKEDEPDVLHRTEWKGTVNIEGVGSAEINLKFNSPTFSCWWNFGGTQYDENGTYSISGSTVTFKIGNDTSIGTLSENEDTLTFASFKYEGNSIDNLTFTKQ